MTEPRRQVLAQLAGVLAAAARRTYQEQRLSVSSPAHLQPPALLGVSDMGLWPLPFAGFEQQIDAHAGHGAAEDWLLARGFLILTQWRDAEGHLVRRWTRQLSRRDCQTPERRALEDRLEERRHARSGTRRA